MGDLPLKKEAREEINTHPLAPPHTRPGQVAVLGPASFPQRRVGVVTFGLQGLHPLEGRSPRAGVRSSARRQEAPPPRQH